MQVFFACFFIFFIFSLFRPKRMNFSALNYSFLKFCDKFRAEVLFMLDKTGKAVYNI